MTFIYFLNTWKPNPRTNFPWHPWHLWEIKTSLEWITETYPPQVLVVRSKQYVKVLVSSKLISRYYWYSYYFPFISSVFTIYIILFQKEIETFISVSTQKDFIGGSIAWLLIQKTGVSFFSYKHLHNCTLVKPEDYPYLGYKNIRDILNYRWSNKIKIQIYFTEIFIFITFCCSCSNISP